jgi:hypothetical protein
MRILPTLIVLLATTSCAFAPTVTQTPLSGNPVVQPAASETIPATQASGLQDTSIPQIAAPENTPAPLTASSGALWVKVLSPEDGATVTTQAVTITGQAPAETVITINDIIVVVPQSQTFAVDIPLQEGSNLIEILASDLNENEVYIPLTIAYEP